VPTSCATGIDRDARSAGPSRVLRLWAGPCRADDDAGMDSNTPALAEVGRDECLSLLEGARLGRVGVSIDALPAIFPVFVTVVDGAVVFRTVPGTKLKAASDGAIVAIEADQFDEATGQGWSVLVRGIAHELTDGTRAEIARSQLSTTWIDGAPEHLVLVSADLVTGRRLG